MGVRGLSTFVNNNHRLLLRRHRFHDTRVIIDGDNIANFLFVHYHVPQQFGGDYDVIAEACRKFFAMLQQSHIVPYVVFDGAYSQDDRKLETFRQRAQNKRDAVNEIYTDNTINEGCLYPILVKEVLMQTLLELGIAHVSCHFEADKEIAVLAKKWKCPVMSNDSDFFVYDLEGGVISLDNISTQLYLYDMQTKKECKFDSALSLEEDQVVYMPVKLYTVDKFTNMYPENVRSFVLPVFATVLGNDFIDRRDLSTFHKKLSIPSNNLRFDVPDDNKRMRKVIHWLDSLEHLEIGLENVVACTNMSRLNKETFREKLIKSIEDYQNLQEFSSLNLVEYFEGGTVSENVGANSDPADVLLDIVDYNGAPLPQWFLDRLVSCEMGAFMLNASLLHREFFACQVEFLEKPSSYMCSMGLRQVSYGMLKITSTPDDADGHDDKNSTWCVVEFDRVGMGEQQNFVEPITELPGFGLLPNLDHLERESEANRKQILFCALEVPSAVIDGIVDENEMSMFMAAVAAYWCRHSEPKVSENDLKSLLVCVLFLHLKRLECVDGTDTASSLIKPAGLHADIVEACKNSSKAHLDNFKTEMDKITSEQPYVVDINITHNFAQFQSCFQAAVLLNQLLLCPVNQPNASLIFSGSIVYKVFRVLYRRKDPDLVIKELLVQDSPLHEQFIKLRKQVVDILVAGQ